MLNEELDKDFVVNVYGQKSEKKDVVFKDEKLEAPPSKELGISLSVIIILHQEENEADLADLKKQLEELFKKYCRDFKNQRELLLIFFRTNSLSSKLSKEELFSSVTETWPGYLKQIFNIDNFILVNEYKENTVKSKISEVLERELANGFLIIRHDLLRFIRCGTPTPAKVISFEQVNTSYQNRAEGQPSKQTESDNLWLKNCKTEIRSFLRNKALTRDLVKDAKDDRLFELAIEALTTTIRCKSVTYLATKHHIPQWVCNSVLIDKGFEKSVAASLSKNTRYHLGNVAKWSMNEHSMKEKFDFVFYNIESDIDKSLFMTDIEKELSKMKRVADVMNKMLSKVNGYVKQTVLQDKLEDTEMKQRDRGANGYVKQTVLQFKSEDTEMKQRDRGANGYVKQTVLRDKSEDIEMKQRDRGANGYVKQTVLQDKSEDTEMKQRDRSAKELRQELLKLDGIYGMGTIYGQLEVHIDTTKPDEIDELQTKINTIMKEHHFNCAYVIKSVCQKPTQLATDFFEQGDTILSSFPDDAAYSLFRMGTLGCFVKGKNKSKVYGLTCAHVVDPQILSRQPVLVEKLQNGDRIRKPFGIGTPAATFNANESDVPFIDIAAFEIRPLFLKECSLSFKDDKGQNKSAKLATEPPEDNTFVYKYGAATNLTTGIVVSNDYYAKGHKSPVVLIEYCPGNPEDMQYINGESSENISQKNTFAKEGDSGAIVCMIDTKLDKVVAVSMIIAGHFKTQTVGETHPDAGKCMSFLLRTGLRKLGKKFIKDKEFFYLS